MSHVQCTHFHVHSDACTANLFQLAKEVHIMLEEQKTESWIYLDVLGEELGLISSERTSTVLQQLQHLGTPVLLILALIDRDTIPDRVQITLCLLLCLLNMAFLLNLIKRCVQV